MSKRPSTADNDKGQRRKAFYRAWDAGKAARTPATKLKGYASALELFDAADFDEPEKRLADDANSALCALWSDIAAAREASRDLAAALEAIDKSLALSEGYDPTPLYNRAVILTKLGRYREAIDFYDQAIAEVRSLYLAPPDEVGDYFFGRGQALESLGEREKAIESYTYALPVNWGGRTLHPEAKARLKALTGKVPPRSKRRWPEK